MAGNLAFSENFADNSTFLQGLADLTHRLKTLGDRINRVEERIRMFNELKEHKNINHVLSEIHRAKKEKAELQELYDKLGREEKKLQMKKYAALTQFAGKKRSIFAVSECYAK